MGKNQRHVLARPLIILLAVAAAGVAQECNSKLDGKLLLAEENRIYTMNPETGVKSVYASSPWATDLAYDLQRGVLYWSDLITRQIYGLKEGDETGDVYVGRTRWLPCSIVHDLITNKVYVAEKLSNSVFAFDLRRNKQVTVVNQNLTNVKALALDPYEGYLFVLDKYQIVRTDLDGKNRKVLLEEFGNIQEYIDEALDFLKKYLERSKRMDPSVYKKELTISNIAVDTKTKRLYWVNMHARKIESFDYDGQGRRSHYEYETGLKDTFGKITLIDDTIYWSEDSTKRILKLNPNGGDSQVIALNVTVRSLKGVDCSRYRSLPNACASDNGQCEHLCFPSRSSEDNVSCACQIGYRLGQDGKSCVPVKDFVIFARNDFLHGLSLDGSASAIDPSEYQVGGTAILDFDVAENVVYYNGRYPNNKLYRLYLDTGKTEILTPDLLSQDVRNVAFDWNTKNLYYLSYYFADVISLNVLNTREPTYSKIVLENLQRLVRGIVLHPNKGYLYIAQLDDASSSGTISRVDTDGSNFKVIVKMNNIQTLDGLTIDYDEDRVYWSEAKKTDDNQWITRVRHSDLDGQDIRQLALPSRLEHPSDLAVFGDSIYAVGGREETLLRLSKSNPQEHELLAQAGSSGTMSGLKVFSGVTQRTKAGHPCIDGHGCGKFCFAVPSIHGLKATCGCPYGERLTADGKGCEDNSAVESPFKPCKHSFKCNKQTE